MTVKTLYERLESVDGKKIIRRIQDLSQRTSQLHEKINYMKKASKKSFYVLIN